MSFIKGFEINFHSFADYLQTEDIIIIPKKVLNQSGFSGDLSISPTAVRLRMKNN